MIFAELVGRRLNLTFSKLTLLMLRTGPSRCASISRERVSSYEQARLATIRMVEIDTLPGGKPLIHRG